MGDAALLAIDSSTQALCVAACAAGRSAAWSGEGGAQASHVLLARVHDVLGQVSLQLRDVQAVGFGRGPGAFTGLRTACAVAQGLAFGIERPVVPVDSLLLVAEAARACGLAGVGQAHVGVVMDARMAEVYAARYAWSAGRWTTLQPPGLWAPAELDAAWLGATWPEWWTGSGLALLDSRGSRKELATTDDDRAQALLQLVMQGWEDGLAVPASEALPQYLRDKVALTTAERGAQAAIRNAA